MRYRQQSRIICMQLCRRMLGAGNGKRIGRAIAFLGRETALGYFVEKAGRFPAPLGVGQGFRRME